MGSIPLANFRDYGATSAEIPPMRELLADWPGPAVAKRRTVVIVENRSSRDQ